MERYYCLADLLISKQHPVLFSGDIGVGKSALVDVIIVSSSFRFTQLFRGGD